MTSPSAWQLTHGWRFLTLPGYLVVLLFDFLLWDFLYWPLFSVSSLLLGYQLDFNYPLLVPWTHRQGVEMESTRNRKGSDRQPCGLRMTNAGQENLMGNSKAPVGQKADRRAGRRISRVREGGHNLSSRNSKGK